MPSQQYTHKIREVDKIFHLMPAIAVEIPNLDRQIILDSDKVVDGFVWSIGRNEKRDRNSHIYIDDPSQYISRLHAQVRYEVGEGWQIRDWDEVRGKASSVGLFKGRASKPLVPQVWYLIQHGDRYYLGQRLDFWVQFNYSDDTVSNLRDDTPTENWTIDKAKAEVTVVNEIDNPWELGGAILKEFSTASPWRYVGYLILAIVIAVVVVAIFSK